MTIIIASLLCALGIGLGLALILAGATGTRLRTIPMKQPGQKLWERLKAKFGPRGAWHLIIGAVVGILLFANTGWVIILIAAPAAAVFLPRMLSQADVKDEIERLEGIQTWTRTVASLVATGSKSLSNALISSLANTPKSIEKEVTTLVTRLTAGWTLTRALRAFADDFDDPTADLLATRLILASKINVSSLTDALNDLAKAISEEVQARREIEAGREINRTTARIATIGNVALLFCATTIFAGYFSYYRTPLGQIVLAILLAANGAALIWMKNMSAIKKPQRLFNTNEEAMP